MLLQRITIIFFAFMIVIPFGIALGSEADSKRHSGVELINKYIEENYQDSRLMTINEIDNSSCGNADDFHRRQCQHCQM